MNQVPAGVAAGVGLVTVVRGDDICGVVAIAAAASGGKVGVTVNSGGGGGGGGG